MSIIIPVFNRFDVADRAVNSVIEQTYTEWELFVVDDSSTHPYSLPNTTLLHTSKITLIRNQINEGPGRSRQKGADLAKGAFICFLDSDDYYHPEFLEHSVKAHKISPHVIGTYTTTLNLPDYSVRKESNISFINILPFLFTNNRPWATCSWLWKNENLPKWRSIRTNQDSLFEIELALSNNQVSHVNRPLCYIDKQTNLNTIDLVGNLTGELNRNEVALFALNNLKGFEKYNNFTEIKKAIIARVIFTCSKLYGLGLLVNVSQSSRILFCHSPLKATIMYLLSLLKVTNPKYKRKISNLILKMR